MSMLPLLPTSAMQRCKAEGGLVGLAHLLRNQVRIPRSPAVRSTAFSCAGAERVRTVSNCKKL